QKLSEELVPSGLSDHVKKGIGLTRGGEAVPIDPAVAQSWARIAFWDILVFFGVLMVGFAYVWRRGDINWVRAYAHHKEPPIEPERTLEQPVHAPTPAPVAAHH